MAADMSTEQKSESATLQVGSEEVKLNMTGEGTRDNLDLHDRDPNGMNEDVKARFHDLFGEPDREIYSFDKVWILSFKVYGITKLWCYRITSLLCALPLAIWWGITFACVSFFRVWCCMPCLRSLETELVCVRRTFDLLLQSFIAPCYEAVGKIFYNIRVTLRRNSEV